MTEVRISYVVWEDNPEKKGKRALDYTPQWKNFCEEVWTDQSRDHIVIQILQADYNARIEKNDIIFASSEDAVRFILRWS